MCAMYCRVPVKYYSVDGKSLRGPAPNVFRVFQGKTAPVEPETCPRGTSGDAGMQSAAVVSPCKNSLWLPPQKYQSIVYSTAAISNGTVIYIYFGGTSSGNLTDGLYTGGTYSCRTKYTSITVSWVATKVTL